MFYSGPRRTLLLASIALPMTMTGCGPSYDEPVTEEVPEPADVGSYEADTADKQMDDPVSVDLYADAVIEPASGSDVSGSLRFHQQDGTTEITGTVRGLAPGEHGLHVHSVGDCSAADASSAQGHFAPDDNRHGSPDDHADLHHVGDLGNIIANEDGVAAIDMTDTVMTLGTDEHSIVGRAVIVHAGSDDLVTQPSGNSGARVGCGVIERDVTPAFQGG